MVSLSQHFGKDRIPDHVAFILDGNRRWAKQRHIPVQEGHRRGFEALKEVLIHGKECGIRYVTAYVFSTENWKRSNAEVSFILQLMEWVIAHEIDVFKQEEIRVRIIGARDGLAPKVIELIERVERETAGFGNERLLQVAFNYGGRREIVDAVRAIVDEGHSSDMISEELVNQHLYTAEVPDPDLLVRTGGDHRISNYLLWQLSYTEFYFTDTLWPDFTPELFDEALADFARRKRNFGT